MAAAQIALAAAPEAGTQTVIHVPGPGAASLADAFATARRLTLTEPGQIIIELAGLFRLTEPIRLGPEDSGAPDAPLVVRSAGRAIARVVGSRPLLPSRDPIPAEIMARLPSAARGKVRLFHLPDFAAAPTRIDVVRRHADAEVPAIPFELFDRQGALVPARWPDTGWARISEASPDPKTFGTSSDRLDRWSSGDLWIAGYLNPEWSYETRPVAALDADRSTITLAEPTHYGARPGGRFFVYHALAELDRPGEWVRLPDRPQVLVWPRTGEAVEISVTDDLFLVDGARHIRFERLALERTRRTAINVRSATDFLVSGSIIGWTGTSGISIVESRNSGIEGSTISDTGAEAVILSGGDRANLTPAGLFVDGSRIARFGRLSRTYRPGIALRGVGNRARGNMITDGPHAAILFSGNDHVIELNEITRVVRETSDAGAIYSGRDWTARGTVIRNNFLHDLRPLPGFETKGIYLDDMASGITIDGNLFLRVNRPVFLGGGRDNIIRGNIFIASEPGIFLDGRGLTWAKPFSGGGKNPIVQALGAVPYRSAPWRERYPELARMSLTKAGEPAGNASRDNLFVGKRLYAVNAEALPNANGFGPDIARTVRQLRYGNALVKAASALDVFTWIRESGIGETAPSLPLYKMDRSPQVPPGRAGEE